MASLDVMTDIVNLIFAFAYTAIVGVFSAWRAVHCKNLGGAPNVCTIDPAASFHPPSES